MKVKNAEVYAAMSSPENGVPILDGLLGEKFPASVTYGLIKMARELAEKYKIIDETKMKLIDNYTDGDRSKLTRGSDKYVEFMGSEEYIKLIEEFNSILGEDVEISNDKVTIPSTVNGKEIVISAKSLSILEPFIEIK